jgi:hypothetical protein
MAGLNFGFPPATSWMPIVGDFNGDGKTDYALLGGSSLYTFLSTGDGTFSYVPSTMADVNFGFPAAASWMAIVGDFNGDGKTDYALLGGNSVYNFLSLGDGTFLSAPSTMPTGINFGIPANSSWLQIPGDFNGDGKADFALLAGTTVYTFQANGPPFNQLTTITTGVGAITTVTYQPFTNSGIYAKDAGATYPLQDLQAPLYVVSRVDTSNGIGGTYSSSYSYAGAKLDLSGRGFLGFRQMAVTDLQTGIVQTTTYRQDFPYIGLLGTTTKILGTLTLNQKTNSYQFRNAGGTTSIAPASAPYKVSVSQSVAQSSDLDGSAMPTATTSFQYDAYGNATSVVASTPDGFSKTTTNTYNNDTTNWYLGRLTRATVTSQAP